MSKITLDIPNETTDKIKLKAKENCRSMTQEIIYTLRLYANDRLREFEEGSQISVKQTITKPKTPEEIEEERISHFKKLAKNILGHEIKDEDWAEYVDIIPDMTYYNFAEAREDGKLIRFAYTMPEEKQKEFLEEWKHYE